MKNEKMENPYIGKDGKDYYSIEALEKANGKDLNMNEILKYLKSIQQTKEESINKNESIQYLQLIVSIIKDTQLIASNFRSSSPSDITYGIVGVDFKKDQIEDKYGLNIYKTVSKSSPEKLGCIIKEGVCASPLISTEYLVTLLQQRGIASYIDFDNMIFHFNSTKNEQKNSTHK